MEQAILAAAEELFLDRGFALTSTVEIAKKAGCNQALVHYYFRTKENLFQAIFARKIKMFMTALTSMDQLDLPFEKALEYIIQAHFDVLASNPRLPFLILNELTTNPKRIEALKDILQNEIDLRPVMHMQALLDQEIRKGTVRPTTMMDIAMAMAALNVMTFVARPIICGVLDISDDDYQEMIAHRRQENVAIILRSIRP
ncbi:MAG TPA: helix-turn-helix domain-containing protein [Myxococcota bacterium]|nr:helix-turn-helix domain-containing protein [Myxococcota bacterium]HOH77747.1 helix-turn-helix domain-containing protein [Myxococcota bacterium]